MAIIAPVLSNWLSPILSEKLPELLKSTNLPFISTTLADFCYDKLFIASGLNITTAALMLTVRTIPVMASISEDARRCSAHLIVKLPILSAPTMGDYLEGGRPGCGLGSVLR